jgi:hypothetical protein
LFGHVITKLAQGDDFADRGIGSRRDFDQIEAATLRFTQRVGEFQDAKLLAAGSDDDPDFASANPAVYTKLWLQIKSVSRTAKRECTALTYFIVAIPTAVCRNTLRLRGCDLPR